MTRRHRLWHLSLWLLIGPLLIAGFAAGIALRLASKVISRRCISGCGNVTLSVVMPTETSFPV